MTLWFIIGCLTALSVGDGSMLRVRLIDVDVCFLLLDFYRSTILQACIFYFCWFADKLPA